MNPLALLRALSQPAKTIAILFYLTFPLAFIGAALGSALPLALVGVASLALGVCMAMNVGGTAQTMMQVANEHPVGRVTAGTWLGTVRWVRICGAGMMAVGSAFILVTLI